MTHLVVQTLRSRRFAVCVHAGFWLLLYFGALRFGGKAPIFRDATAVSTPAQSPAPVAKLETLFSPGIWSRTVAATNLASPFFTRHFIPSPAPPPPAPTIRMVEITYLGFYQTDNGPKQVAVKLADQFVFKPIGANVTTNWFFAEASMNRLTLTNVGAQTNLLLLNAKKEIEVPIP